MTTLLWCVHFAATWYLVGLCWLVQRVQFAQAPGQGSHRGGIIERRRGPGRLLQKPGHQVAGIGVAGHYRRPQVRCRRHLEHGALEFTIQCAVWRVEAHHPVAGFAGHAPGPVAGALGQLDALRAFQGSNFGHLSQRFGNHASGCFICSW